MPRTARILIPNYPHHIIQRGHNRQAVFAAEADYRYYLENLAEGKEDFDCNVYAFCLMTNHVHLVIGPGEDPENLSRLMKRLAGRQTRYVNRLEGRSGTLWEGRFRSSPIENDRYLLACCRYVEMNSVMAGLCEDPAEYPWSSCRSKLADNRYAWLDFDPVYQSFGKCLEERRRSYLDFLNAAVADQEREMIQKAIQRGQLTGSDAFVEEIEAKFNRRVELRGPGRPRKREK